MGGFTIYLRMEYGCGDGFFVVREKNILPGREGRQFLESIVSINPVFFMYFIMRKKEGDADIIKRMLRLINNQSVEAKDIKSLAALDMERACLLR